MKSTVIVSSEDKKEVYHNDFMPSFKRNLAGWLTSSSASDRSSFKGPFYLAIGTGSSANLTNSLIGEVFRVPITAKFPEPVSARTRLLANITATDVNSIPWGEIGLFDAEELAVYINRCDTLGKWQTAETFRLFVSENDAVQDNGALFCEFSPVSTSCDFFYTTDLTDGKGEKQEGALSQSVQFSWAAHVENGTRVFTTPTKIGKDLNTGTTTFPARAAISFDISKLPSDVTFTNVALTGNVTYVSQNPLLNIGPYNNNATNDPSGDSAATQFSNTLGATTYVTQSSVFNKLGTFSVDLGSQAVTDLTTVFATTAKKFSIGLIEDGETTGDRTDIENVSLYITYKRSTALGVNAKSLSKDSDLLQFFLFLSQTSVFPSNNITVTMSSNDSFGVSEWSWTLVTSGLTTGWNFLQLPMGAASLTINPTAPDISHIKGFKITSSNGVTSSGLMGLDNIRIFRPNGNLLNKVTINNNFSKDVGVAYTIQWIIDPDIGI